MHHHLLALKLLFILYNNKVAERIERQNYETLLLIRFQQFSMSQQAELQGFLSIKIPPKMRGFMPWKTWKRQWITIRCLAAGGIDLIIGRNSQNALHISPTDIIVRTQSRSHLYAFGIYPREGATANFCLAGTCETDSQKWISTLRKLLRPPLLPVEENEFVVSVIDNMFTRSSGFPGLYGILRVNDQSLTITDPFTSRIIAQWQWHQLSNLYVTSTVSPEDRGRICTIITSKEFPTGVGKIRLFCMEALSLVKELTRGKSLSFIRFQIPKRSVPYRHHTFSYDYRSKEMSNGLIPWIPLPRRRSSLTDSIKYGRRISKSEGNLLSLFDQLDNSSECSDSGFIHDFYNNLFSACFSDYEGKTSRESGEMSAFRKVGPCIISTGVDMIAVSEMSNDPSHVYQEVRCNSKDDEHCCAVNTGYQRKFSPRRQSGVSVASGLYEEIDELSTSFACALNTVEENASDSPPPLPPRRDTFNRRQRHNLREDNSTLQVPPFPNRYISRSAGNTPLPSPPSLSRTASSAEFFPTAWYNEEESHYLPMNSYTPRPVATFPKEDNFAKDAAEEQLYVVMSSFKKDQT